MKLHIINILFLCICITAVIYGAEQSQSSSSSSAYSQPAISASSIAAINESTHPLAKIFPINLAPIKELEGAIAKTSPDLKYISLARMNSDRSPQNIYDVSKHEMIPNLGVVGHFNDDFTVLKTKANPNDEEEGTTYRFNFYDFQKKIANVRTEPFFTIEGYASYISPNGHYVAIRRKIGNSGVISLYDIKARQHVDPDNVLFNIYSDGWANFSSDSKIMAVNTINKSEVIDIQSAILYPQAPLKIKVVPAFVESITFSKNYRYLIIQNRLKKKTYIYDIIAKMNNPDQAPLAEFETPEASKILGADSAFLALTTDGYNTNIYSLESLYAQPPGAPFYSIQNPPLYSIPGGTPVLISPDNTYIITTYNTYSIILNTSTGKLTKNIQTFKPLFSNDSKLLLAPYLDTTVYDLENDIPLINVTGQAQGLNSDSGVLITQNIPTGMIDWTSKILFFDVKFLNDPAVKKILQGKLTLAQQAFIALLDTYYGSPIFLAAIAKAENMDANAVNGVLRAALNSFPEIIKQAIIKTYKIIDPVITQQELKEHRAQSQSIESKFEQAAGRERLIQKALESKNKGKK